LILFELQFNARKKIKNNVVAKTIECDIYVKTFLSLKAKRHIPLKIEIKQDKIIIKIPPAFKPILISPKEIF
jgi:hypothetical protein